MEITSFKNHHPFISSEQEDSQSYDSTTTPENNGSESPPTSTNKLTSSSTSPKKSSRRSIHKRVVSVPIKGESYGSTPPTDSWAWRKYGQKPIKGSPYPRGYYRCSSSKGCPARKQVERSYVDPTTLVITYSCEHNHAIPASRNNHHHHHSAAISADSKPEILVVRPGSPPEPEEKVSDLGAVSLMEAGDEFGWFSVMEPTTSTVLESPLFMERTAQNDAADLAIIFPMKEEDESLYADLGELPECSFVFRRGIGRGGLLERDVEQRQQCTQPLCGTTS